MAYWKAGATLEDDAGLGTHGTKAYQRLAFAVQEAGSRFVDKLRGKDLTEPASLRR